MTERSFFMELKEIVPGQHLVEPLCTLKKGKAPEQSMPLDEFEAKVDATVNALKDDLDLDFYEGNDFSEEDIADLSDDLNLN